MSITKSQTLNIDDQFLKSYMRQCLHGNLLRDVNYKKYDSRSIRLKMHQVCLEIYNKLKDNKSLYYVYNKMTGKSLPVKYKVKLKKTDLKKIKSISNKVKKIPIGPVGKNSASHAVHNILIKI